MRRPIARQDIRPQLAAEPQVEAQPHRDVQGIERQRRRGEPPRRRPLEEERPPEIAALEREAQTLKQKLQEQIAGLKRVVGENTQAFRKEYGAVDQTLKDLAVKARELDVPISSLLEEPLLRELTDLVDTHNAVVRLLGEKKNVIALPAMEGLIPSGVIEAAATPRKGAFEWLRSKARMIALVAGLGAFGGGAARAVFTSLEGPERPVASDVARDIPQPPAGVERYTSLAGLSSYHAPDGSFELNDERYDRDESREQLTRAVKDSMREGLGAGSSIPNSCTDALQCYLFYDGQMNFSNNRELMAALAEVEGLDQDELRFLKSVMQTGYLAPAPRFEGAITGREPWMAGQFPREAVSVQENNRRQREFFNEELYGRHLAFILTHARSFDLHKGSPQERANAAELLADIIRTRNELAMQDLSVWKNHQSAKVYRTTKRTTWAQGSRDAQKALMEKHGTQMDALFNWYERHSGAFQRLAKPEQRTARGASKRLFERAEHEKMIKIMQALGMDARKSALSRWVVDDIEPTFQEQLGMIHAIDSELRAFVVDTKLAANQ